MKRRQPIQTAYLGALLLLVLSLLGCQTQPAVEALPPDAYVNNALNWIEDNAIAVESVDWTAIRATAESIVAETPTLDGAHDAVDYALEQLHDTLAWFTRPDAPFFGGIGLTAVYPAGVVLQVNPGSPAEEAGIAVGDIVESVNGTPIAPVAGLAQVDFRPEANRPIPVELEIVHEGQRRTITLEPDEFDYEGRPAGRQLPLDGHTVAYVDLPWDVGTDLFATRTQEALAAADGPANCGWIIDLRRNTGGNLWSYLAGLAPLLGEGELGGFVYPDGTEEPWTYRDGKVYWGEQEREEESYVRGARYEASTPGLPVALLMSPITHAAPELLVAAFRGVAPARTFGEPTAGAPHLILHTPLSNGATMYVSGAVGRDREGRLYEGPIVPDETVAIDWQTIGSANDPVIAAAQAWLSEQPSCR